MIKEWLAASFLRGWVRGCRPSKDPMTCGPSTYHSLPTRCDHARIYAVIHMAKGVLIHIRVPADVLRDIEEFSKGRLVGHS